MKLNLQLLSINLVITSFSNYPQNNFHENVNDNFNFFVMRTKTEKVIKPCYEESDYHADFEFNEPAINQESKRVFS